MKKREVSKMILRGFYMIDYDVLAVSRYGDMEHIGNGEGKSVIHYKTFKWI